MLAPRFGGRRQEASAERVAGERRGVASDEFSAATHARPNGESIRRRSPPRPAGTSRSANPLCAHALQSGEGGKDLRPAAREEIAGARGSNAGAKVWRAAGRSPHKVDRGAKPGSVWRAPASCETQSLETLKAAKFFPEPKCPQRIGLGYSRAAMLDCHADPAPPFLAVTAMSAGSRLPLWPRTPKDYRRGLPPSSVISTRGRSPAPSTAEPRRSQELRPVARSHAHLPAWRGPTLWSDCYGSFRTIGRTASAFCIVLCFQRDAGHQARNHDAPGFLASFGNSDGYWPERPGLPNASLSRSGAGMLTLLLGRLGPSARRPPARGGRAGAVTLAGKPLPPRVLGKRRSCWPSTPKICKLPGIRTFRGPLTCAWVYPSSR
jgi:hypothetical protein